MTILVSRPLSESSGGEGVFRFSKTCCFFSLSLSFQVLFFFFSLCLEVGLIRAGIWDRVLDLMVRPCSISYYFITLLSAVLLNTCLRALSSFACELRRYLGLSF